MLQRRLTGPLLAGTLLVILAACGDEPIEDNLVRPAITALEESRDLACGVDATTMRAAVDAYTALNGEPPSDEAAMVDAGLLRSGSEAWDVVDGELVAQHPSCGPVGASGPSPTGTLTDAVTEQGAIDVAEMLASMTPEQVDGVGGIECAREIVEIFAAGEQFVADRDAAPTGFDDLVGAGYLDEPPALWEVDGDRLVAAGGSGCVTPDD